MPAVRLCWLAGDMDRKTVFIIFTNSIPAMIVALLSRMPIIFLSLADLRGGGGTMRLHGLSAEPGVLFHCGLPIC